LENLDSQHLKKKREQWRKYRESHPDYAQRQDQKWREYGKKWMKEHPNYHKQWRKMHPENVRAAQRKYNRKRYHEDPEFRRKRLEQAKEWQKKNREKVREMGRRHDRRRRNQEDRIQYNKKRIIKLKLELIRKLGGKCEKCGYNHNVAALTFHHINGIKGKRSSSPYSNWRKEDIANLKLLCHNCHAELHHPQLTMDSQGKLITG